MSCRPIRLSRWARWALGAFALAVLILPAVPRAQRYVPTADPERPRIKYADSLVSLNDRCIVRMTKLNLRVRPVYVSRQPIGFC
jgi:hypothetical protein